MARGHYHEFGVVLQSHANELKQSIDELRGAEFNRNLAVGYGDNRTADERERDWEQDRDGVVSALEGALKIIRDAL
jgi:hypothetical protein